MNKPHVYSTPKSTVSSIMSSTPSPVTSSLDTSLGSSDTSPPRSPLWEPKDGPPWNDGRVILPGPQPNGMSFPDAHRAFVLNSGPKLFANATTQTHRGVVLRHKLNTQDGVAFSVRSAPARSTLAEISVLAAYSWTIPLEELKLYGQFRGERVILENERDWYGYYSVCYNWGEAVIIDVHREPMGGVNRCSLDVFDSRSIWGPLSNTERRIPLYGQTQLGNVAHGPTPHPFSARSSMSFVPAPNTFGVLNGASDNGATQPTDVQNHA